MLYLLIAVVLVVLVVLMYKKKVKKTTELMIANSGEAVESAQKDFDVELDYTEKSIEYIDNILQTVHEKFINDKRDVDIERLSTIFGSYIGEAIRKTEKHATWLIKRDPENAETTYKLKVNATDLFPIEWCKKRIENGPEENLVHKIRVIKDLA